MTGRKSEGGSGARRRGCVCWGGRAGAGAEPTPPRHSTLSPPTGAQRPLPLLRLDFFFLVIGAHHYPRTPIPGLSRHRRRPDLAGNLPVHCAPISNLEPRFPLRDTMQRRRGASANVSRGGGAGTPTRLGDPLPSACSPPFLGRGEGHRETSGSISSPSCRASHAPPPQVPLGGAWENQGSSAGL